MDELLFVDSTFEKDNTSRYKLSIQLCLDGFSFSILSAEDKCLILFDSKKLNTETDNNSIDVLKDRVRNCEHLNLSYKEVDVVWLTKKACLLPSELFSEALAIDSLQLCHSISKTERINWNKHDHLNAYTVYAIPSSLSDFIESQFPETKISHQTFSFYQNIQKQDINLKHPNVFVQVYDNFFDAFIPDNNQKYFANNFSFKDETDMVYYILNIYKQQKLNTEYSQLILSGKIDETSKAFQILKRYINSVAINHIATELYSHKHVSNAVYNQFTKI